MVMIAVPSRTEIPAYQQLKVKVEGLVKKINDEFGTVRWRPIDYFFQSFPFEKLSAFYQLADIALIVPLRDGMNLVAKEYIASQPRHDGVLILSETAGAAQEMQDALLVNPKHRRAVAKALQRAVTMPKPELKKRAKTLQKQIENAPVQKWAGSFMRSLRAANGGKIRTWTLKNTVLEQLVDEYGDAQSRLLFLDYDGVLAPFKTNPSQAKPSKQLLRLLEKLCSDARNTVVINSGRTSRDLDAWFAGLPLHLAAEHGALTKSPSQKKWHVNRGKTAIPEAKIRPILEYYAEKTPGAQVESKDSSLVWHYRDAHPYTAQKNLVTLRRKLRPLAKKYNLLIEPGHKVLEIREAGVSKGAAARELIKPSQDFILAIGDDLTDESMFRALPKKSYTVKVGAGQTAARYRLASPADVLALLKKLAK
jgi:trehalose 6-phosphate synthase/phosphatase